MDQAGYRSAGTFAPSAAAFPPLAFEGADGLARPVADPRSLAKIIPAIQIVHKAKKDRMIFGSVIASTGFSPLRRQGVAWLSERG